MLAVNFTSTILGKRWHMRSLTTPPRGVMRKYFPSFTTYSLSRIVDTVGA